MCMECDGWTPEEIRQWYLDTIEWRGWAICGVEAGEVVPPFAYTVGLTRYRDHPELLISGLEGEDAAGVLNSLAEHVREGHRYAAGDVVASTSAHRYQLLRVSNRARLAKAQDIYAEGGARLVDGLQVVWTNHEGLWPWDPRWTTRHTDQELFGRPLRRAA